MTSSSAGNVTKPVVVADPTKGVKLDASLVAQPFRDEIKAKVEAMKQSGLGAFSNTGSIIRRRHVCVVWIVSLDATTY
jgi:hypothetical protein